MARVSGQYKRNSQTIIVVVALALAAGLNVDTIDLSRRLWANEAEPGATNGETVVTAVAQEIPIGWTDESTDDLDGWWGVWKVFGLLLTVVATSLGAPFWFDLLNKVVNVRQSGTLPVTFQDTGGV